MNIKYIFDQEQSISSPVLNSSIFASASGTLYNDYSRNGFNKNLQLIEKRIDAIQKELSYWDLYKIVSKVEYPEDLNAKYNNLIVGQALVIDCNSFISDDGDQLHRGDVIIKLSYEDSALIPAINSGYYEPQVTEDQGQLIINYTYKDGAPDASATHLEYSFTESSATNSFIYGIFEAVNSDSYSFNARYYPSATATNKVLVYPVIKFFNNNGNLLEEISYDAKPSFNAAATKWTINFGEKPDILNFIQVK